ncbi:MAG: TIR domain-containing protein [Nitrospira sp.]|nr:MAG: TIR domain-containing protein [Nitrospira sp.]
MEPVDLFYSYAHEDKSLRDELAGHLKIMERRGVIRSWHDGCLTPGQKWDDEINAQLQAADLVLLLVSTDFINSDYIWGHELDVAMKRHANGKISLVPVMLRAVDITGAPFADLQGLPTDRRPVTSWPNRDEAWTDVAKGIRKTVELIQAKWSQLAPSPALTPPAEAPAPPRAMASPAASGEGQSLRFVRPKEILLSSDKPTASTSPTVVTSDPLLDRVVKEFSAKVTEAAKSRGGHDLDPAMAKQYALTLIDAPDQKRILWVDDRPDNNRFEAAALAKLQIEVVAVTSTKAALARLASDPEPFDLVLSDWQRPELHLDTLSAGIHLLRQLRERHLTMPVVFYHASTSERERSARQELAIREGAFGEAVMPDELLGLVISALGVH